MSELQIYLLPTNRCLKNPPTNQPNQTRTKQKHPKNCKNAFSRVCLTCFCTVVYNLTLHDLKKIGATECCFKCLRRHSKYSNTSVVPSGFSLCTSAIALKLINTCEVLCSRSLIWKYKSNAKQSKTWKGYPSSS